MVHITQSLELIDLLPKIMLLEQNNLGVSCASLSLPPCATLYWMGLGLGLYQSFPWILAWPGLEWPGLQAEEGEGHLGPAPVLTGYYTQQRRG